MIIIIVIISIYFPVSRVVARITPLDFLHKCRKKRLRKIIPYIVGDGLAT